MPLFAHFFQNDFVKVFHSFLADLKIFILDFGPYLSDNLYLMVSGNLRLLQTFALAKILGDSFWSIIWM